MLTRMIVHGLLAAMIVAGSAYAYAAAVHHAPLIQYEEHE